MTIAGLYEALYRSALPLYGEQEAASIAHRVMEERFGVDRVMCALDRNREIVAEGLDSVLEDLRRGRPVQYVTGRAYFCGLALHVAEGVLIPRPETEELVEWIARETGGPARVMDVGTGSGAIAVALAYKLPGSSVTATDISPVSLEIARRNASAHGVPVNFIVHDILDRSGDAETGEDRFDVIVSNPPYIPASERIAMHTNVKDFEPAGALFVPDEDPLLFYRAVARFAAGRFAGGGRLYFEIHQDQARNVRLLLEQMGFSGVTVRKDINGRERMVRAVKGCADG